MLHGKLKFLGLFIQLTWITLKKLLCFIKIIIIIIIITIKKGSWLKSLNKSQLIPKSIYLISKYNLQNIQMIQIPQNFKVLTKILNNSSQKQYFKLNLKSWRIGHRKLLQQQLGARYLNSYPLVIQRSHSSTHLSLRTWAANLENEQLE